MQIGHVPSYLRALSLCGAVACIYISSLFIVLFDLCHILNFFSPKDHAQLAALMRMVTFSTTRGTYLYIWHHIAASPRPQMATLRIFPFTLQSALFIFILILFLRSQIDVLAFLILAVLGIKYCKYFEEANKGKSVVVSYGFMFL